MQRLQFFPEPYPDECLYSIFCRYFVRNFDVSHYSIINELFGSNISLLPSVSVPRGLHLLNYWLHENSKITRRMLVENHTMYPYLSIFYPGDMMESMEKHIATGFFDERFERRQLGKSKSTRKEFLCFCPECTKEDMNTYGEAYWHRLHQIQGVLYCPKHGVKIENSIIPMKGIACRFRPASSYAIPSSEKIYSSNHSVFKEQYTKIATDIKWLLNNGLTLGGADTIGRKYKDMYIKKGNIATRHGRVLRNRFDEEIRSFYGDDFLNHVLNIGGRVNQWHRYANASMSDGMRPLHQLLVINFLCGSPENFRDSVYEYAPFGSSPWPCINNHCPHFGVDGINEVEYGFSHHCHIGYFKCDYCGISFRRSKDNQPFDEYSKHVMIIDYGHLWKDKLRDCIFIKNMKQKDIIEEMRVSEKLLKRIGKELNLDINANARYVPNKHPGDSYRQEVLELLEKNVEISSNDVKQMNSRAYSWLIHYDHDWLQNLLTPEKQKFYWREKDERLLAIFQNVYDELQKSGNTRRRITIGYLCALAGITGSLEMQQVKNQLRLTPRLKKFMDSVLETEDTWMKRRIAESIKSIKKDGCRLTINQVRSRITVRQDTFYKYKSYIADAVDRAKVVTMRCPYCNSDKVCKNGREKNWQKYLCRNPDCSYGKFKMPIDTLPTC